MSIELQQASNMAIFGATASGKTYLMKQMMKPYRRVLWFDTTFEIETSETDYEHYFNLKDLKNRLITGESFYRIAYHPTSPDIESEFDLLSRLYWLQSFPRWLVVDECHEMNNSQTLKPQLKYARKRGLGIILASQRIYDVKPHLRTNARSVVLFYAHEERDLIAISSSYGESVAQAVSQLRPLIHDDVTGITKQTPQAVVYRRGQPIEIVDL